MVIREADVDSIRDRVAQARTEDVARLSFDGATLGAVLELACAWIQWRAERRVEADALLDRWCQGIPALRSAYHLLTDEKPLASGVSEFGAPNSELLAIRGAGDWTDVQASLFQGRYARSLMENGFSRQTALGLVAAFAEMADNIVQHSGPTRRQPARGIVAYQVRHRWMSFGAADVGRGVLASLRSNERWRRMEKDDDALTHAVQHGATCRETAMTGNGFAAVHRALVDLSGKLRFRSGRACLALDGQGVARVSSVKACEFMRGFQLSVSCSLDGGARPVAFVHSPQ